MLNMTSPAPLPWIPENTFSDRLIRLGRVMRWSAKEAALACGLPQQSWRNWELAESQPRNFQEVCRRIAERTGVSLAWLAVGEEPAVKEVRHVAPDPPQWLELEVANSSVQHSNVKAGHMPGAEHRLAA